MCFLVHDCLPDAKLHEGRSVSFVHLCLPRTCAQPDPQETSVSMRWTESVRVRLDDRSLGWWKCSVTWLYYCCVVILDYRFQNVTTGKIWEKGTRDLSVLFYTTAQESTTTKKNKRFNFKKLTNKNLSKQMTERQSTKYLTVFFFIQLYRELIDIRRCTSLRRTA